MDCCDEINDKLDIILSRLQGLEDMNINVNCGCGCGCGCKNGESFQDLSQEPGYQPFPDEPIILPGETLNNLCDAANQWADGVTETMQRMKSFFGGLAVTAGSVQAFIGSILKLKKFALVLSPALFIQLVVGAIAIVISANLTDEANDAAEEFEDAFKCAIFTALTPQGAKNNALGIVSQIRQSYGVMVSALFYALVMITDWRALTIENDGLILPEYVGQGDCSGCAGVDDLPQEIVGGYLLLPVNAGDFSSSTATTVEVVSGNTWRMIADDGDGFDIVPDLTEFSHVWDNTDPTGIGRGFRFELLTESGNVVLNDPPDASSINGSVSPVIGVDYRGGVSEIQGWIDQGDEELAMAESVNAHAFRGRAAIAGETECTFRLWVVIEA
jgi:hypothetical protein